MAQAKPSAHVARSCSDVEHGKRVARPHKLRKNASQDSISAKMPIQSHQVNKIPASVLCSGVVQQLRFNQAMIRNRHALMIRCGLTMAKIALSRRECLA